MTKTIVDMAKKNWLRSGDRIYQYVIVSHLSSGGMGEVYFGEDTFTSERVAIKFLATDLANDREMVRRFDLEARLLKNTNHKNIVKIKDYGQYQGIPYIVMEYLDGISLKEIIHKKLTDIPTSIEIMEQLLDAVGHIHRLNIIHRDLKPSNILCLTDMSVKLIDFGIAKDLDEEGDFEITRVGDVIGSTQYLAPEQIRGDKRTLQSDIRNLGMIFYELLVWKYPFEFKNKLNLIDKIKNENIKFPVGSGIPIGLQNIVLRMTEIELKKRYQSTLKVQIDINQVEPSVLDGVPGNGLAFDDQSVSHIKIQKLINSESRKAQIKRHIVKGANKNKKKSAKLYFAAVLTAMSIVVFILIQSNGEKFQKIAVKKQKDFFDKMETHLSSLLPKEHNKLKTNSKQDTKERPDMANVKESQKLSLASQAVKAENQEKAIFKPKVVKAKPVLIKRPRLKDKIQTHTFNNFSKDSVYLSWKSQRNVKYYDLEISKNKKFNKNVFLKRSTKKTSIAWKPLSPGKYFWRVKAYAMDLKSKKYSRVGIINLKSKRPLVKIEGLYERREPAFVGRLVKIGWEHPGYKSKYKVQVSRSGKFSNLEKNYYTNNTFANIKFKKRGSYYVRIVEVDVHSNKKLSPYSNVLKVKVESKKKSRGPQNVIVLAPNLISPKNEAEVNSRNLRFSWIGGILDSGYQIQISKTRNFSDVILEKALTVDYILLKNSLPAGKYYWRVRTKSENGTSGWSSIYFFIIR